MIPVLGAVKVKTTGAAVPPGSIGDGIDFETVDVPSVPLIVKRIVKLAAAKFPMLVTVALAVKLVPARGRFGSRATLICRTAAGGFGCAMFTEWVLIVVNGDPAQPAVSVNLAGFVKFTMLVPDGPQAEAGGVGSRFTTLPPVGWAVKEMSNCSHPLTS